jgi:T5SS/PEP-CTERM-associated repeat protein
MGDVPRAGIWSGTAASFVPLHPAGATVSEAYGTDGSQQVGYAIVGGERTASLWSGSSASWVKLNPFGLTDSIAHSVRDGVQVGQATIGGVTRAGLWLGTAASWLDLHAFLPPGFVYSEARAIASQGGVQIVGFGRRTLSGPDEALLWRAPTVAYVRADLATGNNDGSSWSNAYRDLRTALADLESAPWVRELWVATGTYTPAPPTSQGGQRTASFSLRNNLAIYGGFAGNETALSQRNITQNPTILSGDLNADDNPQNPGINRSDNALSIVTTTPNCVGEVLDGFTIRGCNTNPPGAPFGGGALSVSTGGTPTFNNCRFEDNQSNAGGSAAVVRGAAPTFTDCVFANNRAPTFQNYQGIGTIAVLDNSAPKFRRCAFKDNVAGSLGGAVACYSNFSTSCAFIDCDFLRKQAPQGGAVYFVVTGALDIQNCRFYGNSASATPTTFTGGGGAVAIAATNGAGTCSIVGSLFVGNSSLNPSTGRGGAVFANSNYPVKITNCTFVANSTWTGGAIEASGAGSVVTLTNSLVWDNTNPHFPNPVQSAQISVNPIPNGGSFIFQNSSIQAVGAGGSPSTFDGNDPRFVASPGTGPDGLWGTSYDTGNLRLTQNSPALDTGLTAALNNLDGLSNGDPFDIDNDGNRTESFPWDLDGSPRIQNNTADRGCYEGFRCPTCPNDRQWFSPQSGAWADDSRWSFSLPTLCHFATFDLAGAYDATFATGDQARGFEQSRGDVTLVGVLPTSVLTLAPPAPGQSCPGTAPGIERPSFRVSGAIAESPSLSITRGTVSAKGGFIGDGYLERGSVSVSGIDAKLTFNLGAGLLLVGDSGEGKLAVTNGAKCFAGIAYFGQQDIDLDSPPDGVFDNHATLLVDGTGSALKPKFELVLSNAVATVRNSGVIDCGTFGRVILLNRSVLTGDGEVWGPLLNLGEVAPGDDARATPGPFTPTRLSITGPAGAGGGEFLQIGVDLKTGNQQSGSLRLRASGTGTAIAADTLRVNGTAFLAGTLVVEPVGAFAPATAVPAAPLLIADAITGRFDLAAFPGIDGNRFLRLDYPPQGARAGSVTVSVAPLDQNINLDPPSTANVGGVPSAIAAEDFNGDGFIDLALTVPDSANPTTAPGTVVILINNRNSGSNWNGFQPSGQLTVNVGINPRGLAAARINADNAVDLVVANAGSNNLTVLTNNGAALMSTAQTIAVGTSPVAVTTDVLLPGQPGAATFVAVANQGSNNVSVLNNNAGTLVPAGTLAAGDSPSDITAARLDALSATVDLAVCNKGDNTVTVYYRPPAGGFNPIPSRILPVSTQPVRIRPGAFDEPGGLDNPKEINDLAVTNNGGGSISILLNNNLPDAGAGFQPKADLPCGTNPDSIAVGDLDRDDDQDISVVTTISAQRVVRIFRNDSQPVPGGGFQAAFAPLPQDAYAGTGPRLVIAGDVNEDGREDLIAVNEQAFSFRTLPDGEADRMLVQQPNVSASLSVPPLPACIPADINRDGMVNVSDLTKFLGQFGKPCSTISDPCADFDGNAVVNTTDLTRFLGRFGQPCQ